MKRYFDKILRIVYFTVNNRAAIDRAVLAWPSVHFSLNAQPLAGAVLDLQAVYFVVVVVVVVVVVSSVTRRRSLLGQVLIGTLNHVT